MSERAVRATLGADLLEQEREWFPASEADAARRDLESLVSRGRGRLNEDESGDRAWLSRVVFSHIDARSDELPEGVGFCLTEVLRRRRGACLGRVSLFLALARSFSIALRPVLQDGHVLLISGDGAERTLIETMRGGQELSSTMLARLGLAGSLRVLDDDEFLQLQRANRAVFFTARSGKLELAETQLMSCLSSMPDYTLGWINLAQVRAELGRTDDSEAALCEALSSKPSPVLRQQIIERLSRSALLTANPRAGPRA